MKKMTTNLYLYQPTIIEPIKVYEFLEENLSEIGFRIKLFSRYEFLPPEKAHHSGDFDLKKFKKADFEKGIKSGIIDSFALSNHADLSKPDSFVCYLVDRKYVEPGMLSIHLPTEKDRIDYQIKIQHIFDELTKMLSPSYGFQSESKTIYKGITYQLTGTVFPNERANFSSYLSKTKTIEKIRMMYSVNYFTTDQLETKINDLKLSDLISRHSDVLQTEKLSETVHKITCPSENLSEINDLFGKSGLSVSWFQ